MNQYAVLLMVSTCLIFVRGGVLLYSSTFAIHHSLSPPFQAALFWGGNPILQFSLKQKMRNQLQFCLQKWHFLVGDNVPVENREPGVCCVWRRNTRIIANLLQ